MFDDVPVRLESLPVICDGETNGIDIFGKWHARGLQIVDDVRAEKVAELDLSAVVRLLRARDVLVGVDHRHGGAG